MHLGQRVWNLLTTALLSANFIPASPHDGQAGVTCGRIQRKLGPSVVQTSGVEYIAGATGAWNLFNTDFHPACIVFPREAAHVQTAMEAIYRDRVRYAVQAGSHSAMKGWNNVNDGVLILFTYMKDVSYDAVNGTITLEPGTHWAEAMSALEPHNVTVLGGRLGDVGTGLLLGGGLSFLSPAHGFSADMYKEVDVVLVTGNLVTATATNEYADLFRSLKGGANRFGIVTRYELYPVYTGPKETKDWYGGLIFYPNSSAEALVNATAHYVRDVKDPKASIMVTLISVIDAGVITPHHLVTAFYHGPELPSDIFGELLSIPSSGSHLGPMSYYDVANTLGAGEQRGNGQLFGASALNGDESQYLEAFRNWSNFTNTFKNDLNSTVLAFTPVLDPQIQAGRARGGNVINPPDGGYAAVQLQTTLPEGVTEVPPDLENGRQLLFQQMPPSPGLPLYVGECDAAQNVFATYGDYAFLKRTYAKYDPTRFNMRYTQGPIGL